VSPIPLAVRHRRLEVEEVPVAIPVVRIVSDLERIDEQVRPTVGALPVCVKEQPQVRDSLFEVGPGRSLFRVVQTVAILLSKPGDAASSSSTRGNSKSQTRRSSGSGGSTPSR
jgi:hypothetical protein